MAPLSILSPLIAAAVSIALGLGYGLALGANPAAIANPILTIALMFAWGFVVVHMVRLGRIHRASIAFAIGTALFIALMVASFAGLALQAGEPWTSGWAVWKARWAAGVTLIPRKWPLTGGGWAWTFLSLEALLLFLAYSATSTVEAARPFCQRCKTWSRKGRWTLEMPSPHEMILKEVKASKSADTLITLNPGTGKGTLRTTIGACKCGATATLSSHWIPPKGDDSTSVKDEILADIPIHPKAMERVFAWGEAINPALAGRRPAALAVDTQREPFTQTPRPDGPEWTSLSRIGVTSYPLGITDAADNPYTAALRKRLIAGDFYAVAEAFKAQRSADDLAFVAHACADWASEEPFMLAWAAEDEMSHAHLLTRGIYEVLHAWKVRGGGFDVKNIDKVISITTVADQLLQHATDAAAKDPTPWAWRMQAVKTRDAALEEMQQFFAEVLARAPHHRLAHTIMLEGFMGKWYGSHDQMFEFARATSAKSAAASPLHVLIPLAHWEYASRQDKPGAAAYFADPAHGREIRAAHDRAFHAGVLKPNMDTPWVRAHFAMSLWKFGQKDAAAEHLRLMTHHHGFFGPGLPLMDEFSLSRAKKECGVH